MGLKCNSPRTSYYAQANGQAEASNKVLIQILEKMIQGNPRDWHNLLSETLWAYRTSKRSATGTTPFAVTYGHDAMQGLTVVCRRFRWVVRPLGPLGRFVFLLYPWISGHGRFLCFLHILCKPARHMFYPPFFILSRTSTCCYSWSNGHLQIIFIRHVILHDIILIRENSSKRTIPIRRFRNWSRHNLIVAKLSAEIWRRIQLHSTLKWPTRHGNSPK